jgi:hypothetical protein
MPTAVYLPLTRTGPSNQDRAIVPHRPSRANNRGTTMKTIIPIICLIIGAAAGFASGQWEGQADTLRTYASTPGVDPTYANALSDDAVYRSRAKMEKGR